MDYIYLQGSEDVKRAGYNIQSASEQIQSSANTISNALYEHKQFMEEWLNRLENILKNYEI